MYIHEIVFFFFFQYCQSQGGNLVELNTQEESDIIFVNKDLIGIDYLFWLGLHKISDDWAWISGDPLNWTNWREGQPDGDDRDCAYVSNHSFEWCDYGCWYHVGTLCEA